VTKRTADLEATAPLSLRECSFYGILDTEYVSRTDWTRKYRALVKGGAGIIQLRAKKESSKARETLLVRILEIRNEVEDESQPPLILNDDLELCLRYANVGLHIGQEDTPSIDARSRLGPHRILGLSTHSIQQARQAMELPEGILDYFAVGPVFATQTKPSYTPVGLEMVRWVDQQSPKLPFFCIGGINRGNRNEVSKAGGSRVVAVSDPLLAQDTCAAVEEYTR
tara:strand:- start:969 stop:1643 length:675 start_codon:yes stop_codon:yes gene_type:complete